MGTNITQCWVQLSTTSYCNVLYYAEEFKQAIEVGRKLGTLKFKVTGKVRCRVLSNWGG